MTTNTTSTSNVEQYLDAEGNLVVPRGVTITWRSNGQEHTIATQDTDPNGNALTIPMALLNGLMGETEEEEEERGQQMMEDELDMRMGKFNDYVNKKLGLLKYKVCLGNVNLCKLKNDYADVLRGKATGDPKELLATCKQVGAMVKTLRSEFLMLCALKFYKTDRALWLYERQKECLQNYIELCEDYCHTSKSTKMCLQKPDGGFCSAEAAYLEQCNEGKVFYDHCVEHWRQYEDSEELRQKAGIESMGTDEEWEEWVDRQTTNFSDDLVGHCIEQVKKAYEAAPVLR